MSDRLVISVPSKGRLQEQTIAVFERAGLRLRQRGGARAYRGTLEETESVDVLFLSAAEITERLAEGAIHLGVTGEDLVQEHVPSPEAKVALLAPLGFGNADVVVAVPSVWLDVNTMADLEECSSALYMKGTCMRVATKYANLTRRFFSERGLEDYCIVGSGGATEGAPAAGRAEIIVDITTTGATLAANALKTLKDGRILRSEAHLVASLKAHWNQSNLEIARWILQRVVAKESAMLMREARIEARNQAAFDQVPPAFSARRIGPASEGAMLFLVPLPEAHEFCRWSLLKGATAAVLREPDFVYTTHNPPWSRLANRLGIADG
jgi:ATP phosphoribosyltransferase